MKRLYLVGRSEDNTKLYLARSKNAKSGTLELPISADLLRAIREAAEELGADPDGDRPAKGVPPRRKGRRGLPPGGFEQATGLGADLEGVRAVIREPPDERASPDAAAAEGRGLIGPASDPSRRAGARRGARLRAQSKLSPAEIQRLLRAGRGVRSVARQAEAPLDWVRRLAQPIEDERVGVVTQMLRSYVVRARLGRSASPLGAAIIENLRDRGLRFPERVVEEGWSAIRPDGRLWRVRFTYESRGRRQKAEWDFDPQTRDVRPRNDLAAHIGFRSQDEADGVPRAAAEWEAAAIRPHTSHQTRAGRRSKRSASARRAATRPRKTKSRKTSPGGSGRSGR